MQGSSVGSPSQERWVTQGLSRRGFWQREPLLLLLFFSGSRACARLIKEPPLCKRRAFLLCPRGAESISYSRRKQVNTAPSGPHAREFLEKDVASLASRNVLNARKYAAAILAGPSEVDF